MSKTSAPSGDPCPSSIPEIPLPVLESMPGTLRVLSPSQMVALLTLYGSVAASAVLVRLRSSTVRAGYRDYADLAELDLAARDRRGFHMLTIHGRYCAMVLTRELVGKFKVHVSYATRGNRRDGYTAAQSTW